MAHGQSITQALTIAYDHAPDLQAALLSAKSSAENVALANAGKRPTIGASIGGNYSWSAGQASPTNPSGAFSGSQTYTAGLSYSQTIFDNFKTEAQIEAARAGAEAAEYQIRNTEQNVLLAVVDAYMSVLSGRQLVALRQDNISFAQAQLQSAQDRLDVLAVYSLIVNGVERDLWDLQDGSADAQFVSTFKASYSPPPVD